MKSKQTYGIRRAVGDVVSAFLSASKTIRHGLVIPDETTIRTVINDRMDAMDREGFTVRHDYNQQAAVRSVISTLKKVSSR
jgi:uncharacterized protein (UPF0218 family)